MNSKKGSAQSLRMSLLAKEATYDAAVTPITTAKFCELFGHSDFSPDWADTVVNNKDTVTGTEFGTDQEIIGQGLKFQLAFPAVVPNVWTAFWAMALGSVTSTQDGATGAYSHVMVPVAIGSSLPSVNAIGQKGGIQYLYKGVKCSGLEVKGEEGKPISLSADFVGSGSRSVDAGAALVKISESWMLCKNAKVWLESGANRSLAAVATQGLEDISSATPDVLHTRIKSFSVKYNNNPEEQVAMGAAGVLTDLYFGRRSIECSCVLRFNDAAEIAYYTAQEFLNIEFDITGSTIPGGGTTKFGGSIRLTQMKLKKAPLPQGGVSDPLTCQLDFEVFEDGTNPPILVAGYNAVAAYLV